MAGTVSKPIFVKDGQYMSFTVETAAITLGQVVCLGTTGDQVLIGTAANDHKAIGVAVGGDRYSRTATDNSVGVGQKVTVLTRGVAYVTSDTSAILVGSLVEAADDGKVQLHTPGTTNHQDVLGMALDANGSASTQIRVKLFRG